MFSPIDLHLRPSWLTAFLFIAPALCAIAIMAQTKLPLSYVLLFGLIFATVAGWHALKYGMLWSRHSIKRLNIRADAIQVTENSGKQWRGELLNTSHFAYGLYFLHLRRCDVLDGQHTTLMLHALALTNRDDARRLRVHLRFRKLSDKREQSSA